jgi:phosphoglycerol transferase MdoB-like AlkP superfamily enzyme
MVFATVTAALREAMGLRVDLKTPARQRTRYALLWLVFAWAWLAATVTRAVLAAKAFHAGQVGAADLPQIFAVGAGYDFITCVYLAAPFALYLWLLPSRLYRSRAHALLLRAGLALSAFGLIYLGAVEYFFFDEFNARFNFVAVEYLIYPHEVFVNIWESYPVGRVVVAAALLALALTWLSRAAVRDALDARESLRARTVPAAAVVLFLATTGFAVNGETGRSGANRVADELAANGIYSFFSAAANSRLDYEQYYLTLDEADAARRARRLVAQPNTEFLVGAPSPLARHVSYPGPSRRLHVIVLLEESLGAEFVGAYGDKRGLTPNLDRIARDSLVFTRTYATGTRTVRGMEAVTASFPPVPAESIVKRDHNEGMFNWSTVMERNGYSPTFIYGGYGTFDNMNYYFSHNGYRVVDRTDMEEPRFSNIWGVSDEDLFRNALRIYDEQAARGERVFSVVMTTSNHKPFTFPEGIAGVPPKGGGREAGVRYADYAIGRFMEALQARPWFGNTLVVIVADHGARVYGREEIPVRSYEIPFLVHSPRHIAAGRVTTVVSQLDVAPTVLGLLNISYDSTFFGRDALLAEPGREMAPLNHNRDVALLAGRALVELGFRKSHKTLEYDLARNVQTPALENDDGVRNAASLFQLAYDLYARRRYRLN